MYLSFLVSGDKFCVGSGATLAYSIIDSMLPNVPSWDVDGAFAVALNAVSKATLRDGYSGGYVNLIHINASGVHHIKHIDSRMLHDQHTNIPL